MERTKLILVHGKDMVDFGSWKGRICFWFMERTKLILVHGKDEVDFGSWKGRS